MENLYIRILVSDSGLKYKDIASEMNISPEYLSRLMRWELSNENRSRILEAITELTEAPKKEKKYRWVESDTKIMCCECKKAFSKQFYKVRNYCPNCGADMREEE